MAANWELQLLSSVIINKDLKTLIDAGISSTCFGSLEARTLYDFMMGVYNDASHYGEVASAELVRENFPRLELPTPLQSLPALCKKVVQEQLKRRLRNLIQNAESQIEDNPDTALQCLQDGIMEAAEMYADNGDTSFESAALDALTVDYYSPPNSGGIAWPWPELTAIAGPIERGTLNIIYGIPKSQKTWIALLTGAYARERGARVLIYSREMTIIRLMRRVACILTRTSYSKYVDRELSHEQEIFFYEYLEKMRGEAVAQEVAEETEDRGGIIFTKGMNKTDLAIPILRRKIEAYKPDLVVLDSAYHLSKGMDWRDITKLTQSLKGVADDTGVPLIAVTQENERAAFAYKGTRGTASMASSPSWAQDADILLRCILKDDALSIHISANRERKSGGPNGAKGIRVHAEPADNYSFIDHQVEDYDLGGDDKEASTPENSPPPRRSLGLGSLDGGSGNFG